MIWRCVFALSLVMALSGTALAQVLYLPDAMRWKGAFDVGYDFTFSSPFTATAAGTLTSVPATFQDTQFENGFSTPRRMGADLSYAVTNTSEVFARFSYTQADGRNTIVGTYTLAQLPVEAKFNNYSAYNARIGYRQYFDLPDTLLTPYAAVSGGVSYVNSIKADVIVPATTVVFNDVKFYEASVVPTADLDLGLLYPLSNAFAVGLETGLHYQFNLKDDDSFFGGASASGLEGVNNEGARLSVPLAVRGVMKF